MKINALTNSNNKSIYSNKQNLQKNFKGHFFYGMGLEEAKNLYEDGPHIYATMKKIIPMIEKKFGKDFDTAITIKKDFFRHILIELKPKNIDNLEYYIEQNNQNKFKFDQDTIKKIKPFYRSQNSWLERFGIEVHKGRFDKDTIVQKVQEKINKINIDEEIINSCKNAEKNIA